MYDPKVIAGLIASLIGVLSYAPYIRDIIKRKTKPHAYTWFVWGITSLLVFFFQYRAGGGAGTWLTLAGGLSVISIFLLSLRYGTRDITKKDALFLVLALVAFGLWIITNQPLISVLLLIAIDMFGFLPTIRKSWSKPYTETLFTYALYALCLAISIYALHIYTLVTYLYPVVWLFGNGLFSVVLVVRRKQVGKRK